MYRTQSQNAEAHGIISRINIETGNHITGLLKYTRIRLKTIVKVSLKILMKLFMAEQDLIPKRIQIRQVIKQILYLIIPI